MARRLVLTELATAITWLHPNPIFLPEGKTSVSQSDVVYRHKREASSMDVVQISKEGQVVIPEALRAAHQWVAGQEFTVITVGDEILLKPKKPFPETTLEDV
ncbi:MAG: AbrB/MazE/SpoVT family DNA-binding domain-containing protein, partial [Cyanobacteria bacterium J06636_16]